ncbi:MAG: DUF1015 domain-containing protein [Candidatus Omnitrophota bacterium]
MPKIKAFQGVRYNSSKVVLKDVVCPPYDVINSKQKEEYKGNSPYNIVRIILPDSEKDSGIDYAKLDNSLNQWADKGIIVKDDEAALYIYSQQYEVDGTYYERSGVLGLVELKSEKEREVLPHEKVFQGPLLDRARLMQELKSHLSPIFIIFKDNKATATDLILDIVKSKKPDDEADMDGINNRLWKVTDKNFIEQLTVLMKNAGVFIADGHHRFEASMKVNDYFTQKGLKDGGHKYTLAYFVSCDDPGLIILPTYRAVKKLPEGFSFDYIIEKAGEYFDCDKIAVEDVDKVLLDAANAGKHIFVFYLDGRYMAITLKDNDIIRKFSLKDKSECWNNLDVSILHNMIFVELLGIKEEIDEKKNVYYYKDRKELLSDLKEGKFNLGVFFNAPSVADVEEVADAGERMPQKSTYFYPKPLTGMVMHRW